MRFKTEAKKRHENYFPAKDRQVRASSLPGRAQGHWLNESSAKEGKNFYHDYEVYKKVKEWRKHKINIPEWFKDTVRSQHIPFNFFIPLKTEKELAIKVFNELFSLKITEIKKIEFEYPQTKDNPLNDRTSFDVFISYTSNDKKGFIGIEIKYTEGGYSPTKKERELINDEKSIYYKYTKESQMYLKESILWLKKNAYRQLWRNHLLAIGFAKNEKYDQFISATFFPNGNEHFVDAIKEFEHFLTEKGKETFQGITYEDFFNTLLDHAETDKQRNWINYLTTRYLLK